MGCAEFGAQLAIFRELSPAERERLQVHLATCLDCAATLAAYMEQDRLLSTLPTLRPSAKLTANILAHTVGRRRISQAPAWRWASAGLATLLIFLVIMGGTIGAAAEALPGDTLYPVKRAVEEVRLTFTFNPAARESYEQLLVMTRLEETRAVLQEGREADVEFQGPLEATAQGEWSVGGIKVQIAPDTWEATPPQPGTVVRVEGRASGGQLSAQRVSIVPSKTATPAPGVSPTESLEASPTASKASPTMPPKPSPTTQPKEGEMVPTLRPSDTSEPKPLPSPSLTPDTTRPVRLTWTPRIVPPLTRVPTRTPEHLQPTAEPSATTESTWSPTPRAQRTLLPRPTTRPAHTPTGVEPYPLPTRTPWARPTRTRQPTPRLTPTPEDERPTPLPTQTPRGPVRTPKPSVTPRDPDPTRPPSRTPRASWPSPTATLSQDQPWPTDTSIPPTVTPCPTNTDPSSAATPAPPTHTPIPSTETAVPPTSTPGPTPVPTCPICYSSDP